MTKVLFKPYPYVPKTDGIQFLQSQSKRNWVYAPNGRAALYHILKGLRVKTILLPAFICYSVIESIEWADVKYDFFDLSKESILPSFDNLKEALEKKSYDAVLWPTMYGQPDGLYEVQELCRHYNVKMIDDAAQAFGAKSRNLLVGEFGDAGFFSFSPGKPTSTAMGAFYWCSSPSLVEQKSHGWFHHIKHFEFNVNRLQRWSFLKIFKIDFILVLMNALLSKRMFYYADRMESFEAPILGGIIARELDEEEVRERRDKFNLLVKVLGSNQAFRVVKGEAETANPHKLVIYFSDIKMCQSLKNALAVARIRFGNGYRSLSLSCPMSIQVTGHIVELPVDKDHQEFNELLDVVLSWQSKLKAQVTSEGK